MCIVQYVYVLWDMTGIFELNQQEGEGCLFRTASNICAFIYNYAKKNKVFGSFHHGLIILLAGPMKL
jgi:hypothetical protein